MHNLWDENDLITQHIQGARRQNFLRRLHVEAEDADAFEWVGLVRVWCQLLSLNCDWITVNIIKFVERILGFIFQKAFLWESTWLVYVNRVITLCSESARKLFLKSFEDSKCCNAFPNTTKHTIDLRIARSYRIASIKLLYLCPWNSLASFRYSPLIHHTSSGHHSSTPPHLDEVLRAASQKTRRYIAVNLWQERANKLFGFTISPSSQPSCHISRAAELPLYTPRVCELRNYIRLYYYSPAYYSYD